MAGSQIPSIQLRRDSQESFLSHWSTGSQHVENPDTMSAYVRDHLMSKPIPDQLETNLKGGAIRRRFNKSRHDSTLSADRFIHSTITTANSDPTEVHISLADQYLDTMVMDDKWRALCLETIRLNQRRQYLLKRRNTKSTTRQNRPTTATGRPRRDTSCVGKITAKHLASTPPTPPISPKAAHRKQPRSTRSDSGFISSSPSPAPLAYLRLRSTRNYPVTNAPVTMSIDVSPSMIGRTCLSCRSANTTCWRRTLGDIICNSCGLRSLVVLAAMLIVDTKNAALFVQM